MVSLWILKRSFVRGGTRDESRSSGHGVNATCEGRNGSGDDIENDFYIRAKNSQDKVNWRAVFIQQYRRWLGIGGDRSDRAGSWSVADSRYTCLSKKVENVPDNADEPTTSRETARQVEKTAVVVVDVGEKSFEYKKNLETDLHDGERLLQANGDIGVLGGLVSTCGGDAGAQAAAVKEFTPDATGQQLEMDNEAEEHNIDCTMSDNKPDNFHRSLN